MNSIATLYSVFKNHPTICTDTRKIEQGCIFFALKGPNFNANAFAEEALGKEAAYAVIDEEQYKKNDQYILVDDVLTTLQELAKYHRKQLQLPVIAIVGSNGKTTTKELITSVLSQKYKVLATLGNFNNHIGLPLTLLQLTSAHQIAVIEMGANHVDENAFLCEIACPDFGLVTNNGKDHLEGFGSMEGVAQSNSELYYYLLKNNGLAFVNANDEWLMRMASRLDKKYTYAANAEQKNARADCVGVATSLRPTIQFQLLHSSLSITSALSGDYNFDNIMAAVAIGKEFKLSEEEIKKGIELYEPKNNRSQVIKKQHNTIYMDAYNANPSSMEASLRNFSAMPFEGKIAIIGDMFEMGKYAEEEHSNMIELCKELKLEEVILVGEEFNKQNKETSFASFKTTEEVVRYLQQRNLNDKNIFMKGSRGMKLENIAEVIS
jgi:UDP-N-acetylmuramoyl-tripeptide--D-alanyl-D-alanine ligase